MTPSCETIPHVEYRYASLLRPLGSWISLDCEYRIEDPQETDIDPFRADWKAHDVLITGYPLPLEEIASLQLTDIAEMQKRKALYDHLFEMTLNVKVERYETMIKDELGDKIRSGKIKNENVLNKMIEKYVNYANGGA
ncbi:hypothetical protein [Methanosarcina mazei]|uniref:hypothetical protein n=1 Tax=Methanosarcina mazei TaxID=2209 RepID=UPI000AEA7AE4|nr:hypothetical protein [Methanosarcina mazei]